MTVFVSFSGILTRFKSSTYTTTIANPNSNLLIKMYGQIWLFSNPSSLSPDCFNSYKDLIYTRIFVAWGFELYALGILYPSGIYILLAFYILQGFSCIYHYQMIHIDMRISKFSLITKLIKDLNVLAFISVAYIPS